MIGNHGYHYSGQSEYILRDRPTQYVLDSGSDAASGSLNSPVLTIAQAITNSTHGGRIVVLPGTYAGAVDASALTDLEIYNCGTITHDGNVTLTLGHRAYLHGPGLVQNTDTDSYDTAISAAGADDILIENTRIDAVADAISLNACERAIVRRVQITAGEYGVYVTGGPTLTTVERCHIQLAGWTTCFATGIACVSNQRTVIQSIRNNITVTVPEGTNAKIPSALLTGSGHIADVGSYLYSKSLSGTHGGETVLATSASGTVSLDHSIVRADGPAPYVIKLAAAAVCTVHGADYDTTLLDVGAGTLQFVPALVSLAAAVEANAAALEHIEDHIHSNSFIWPILGAGETIISHNTAYTLGTAVVVVAADAIALPFDIHYINGDMDDNGEYDLYFFAGGVAMGSCVVKKSATKDFFDGRFMLTRKVAANAEITVQMAHSVGSLAEITNFKMEIHTY